MVISEKNMGYSVRYSKKILTQNNNNIWVDCRDKQIIAEQFNSFLRQFVEQTNEIYISITDQILETQINSRFAFHSIDNTDTLVSIPCGLIRLSCHRQVKRF